MSPRHAGLAASAVTRPGRAESVCDSDSGSRPEDPRGNPQRCPGSARPFSASRKVFFFPTRLARAPELRYLIPARVWTRDPWSPAELGLPA